MTRGTINNKGSEDDRGDIHIMMPSGLYPAAVMVLPASRLPSL